ncbi:MAG: FCD domain-containing protein, partial [Mycobacterium sp.]
RMGSLLNLTVNFVPLRFFGSIPGWSAASVHDHTDILDALRDRDPEAARLAMTAHIEHIGRLLVTHLAAQNILT